MAFFSFAAECRENPNTCGIFVNSVRISLFVIAAALLAAHFFRVSNFLLVALCLATPLLFLYKNRWSRIVLQFTAYCATATAAATRLGVAFELIQFRQQLDRPWTAAVIILGAVALFTLVSGLLMNSRCMRERYPFWSFPLLESV